MQRKKVSPDASFSGASALWEMSDRIGILRAKKDIWPSLKQLVLRNYANKLDALEKFAIRDMNKGKYDIIPFLKLPSEKSRAVQQVLEEAPKQ